MSDLEDKNRDSDGKVVIRFSRTNYLVKKFDDPAKFTSEEYAQYELELLKLRTLANSFEIGHGPDMWPRLALKLAQLQYPEHKKIGRKLKWSNAIRHLLKTQVDEKAGPKGSTVGINKAIKQLANIEPWITLLGGQRNNSEALRIQYYKAIK